MENLLLVALEEGYTFKCRGVVGLEDLFNLGKGDLELVYKNLRAEMTDKTNALFDTSKVDETLKNKLEIVELIATRRKEKESRINDDIAKAQEKNRLLEALANKKTQSLENLTEEEIIEKLKEVEER